MDLNWRGSGAPIRIRPASPASQAPRIIPINTEVSHAAHVSILNEPLTPGQILTQAERWLSNAEHHLTRRIMSREENITAALRDLVPTVEKLEQLADGLDAAGPNVADAYLTCTKDHAAMAALQRARGWNREAETEIRHAVVDGRRVIAALRQGMTGRAS